MRVQRRVRQVPLVFCLMILTSYFQAGQSVWWVANLSLVTSLVSILLLFRMSFSVVEGLGLPSVYTKASGRDSKKYLSSVEVSCWLNVYSLVNAKVSRVALEQEGPTNRTPLNSVSNYIFFSWRDLATALVSPFASISLGGSLMVL